MTPSRTRKLTPTASLPECFMVGATGASKIDTPSQNLPSRKKSSKNNWTFSDSATVKIERLRARPDSRCLSEAREVCERSFGVGQCEPKTSVGHSSDICRPSIWPSANDRQECPSLQLRDHPSRNSNPQAALDPAEEWSFAFVVVATAGPVLFANNWGKCSSSWQCNERAG